MDYKKTVASTLGGATIGAVMAGKKGLKEGLGLGIKIGVGATLATAFLGNRLYKKGKKKFNKETA